MDNGKSTGGHDRIFEIAGEISAAGAHIAALLAELAEIARHNPGDEARILEIVCRHSRDSALISRALVDLVSIAVRVQVPAAAAVAPAPAVERVEVSPDELQDLASRSGVWELDLFDPRFEPPLTQGQRFVLALLQTLASDRHRLHPVVTLPTLMSSLRKNPLTGTRKDAMWLLDTLTTLGPDEIAALFGKTAGTVKGYISEGRFHATELLALARPAYVLARLDLP